MSQVRIGTWIDEQVDARLRQLAIIRRQRLGRLLSELLDGALPSAADLSRQLGGGQQGD